MDDFEEEVESESGWLSRWRERGQRSRVQAFRSAQQIASGLWGGWSSRHQMELQIGACSDMSCTRLRAWRKGLEEMG